MASKRHFVKQVIVGAIIAFILDAVVLSGFAKTFYATQMHFILRQNFGKISLIAAIAVYLLIGIGIAYFVKPTTHKPLKAFGIGALFGLITYGIYDLTNYALIITWSAKLTFFDMAWGVILNAIVAYSLCKLFSKK